jgi:hypothetical protein
MKLDHCRQDKAIQYGLVIVISQIGFQSKHLNQFLIPIVCELIRNNSALDHLWRQGIFDMLLDSICDGCWKNFILDAIIHWHLKEPKKVESVLILRSKYLLEGLLSSPVNDLEQLMTQIYRLISQSPSLCKLFVKDNFINTLLQYAKPDGSPQTLTHVLKILMLFTHPSFAYYWKSEDKCKVLEKLHVLKGNVSVIVRDLANRMQLSL